jgi:pyrroline-5-carboxylate reductase
MTQKIGFIGIGMFAVYTVKGLRNGGNNDTIYLSPRGKNNADELAKTQQCTVLDSNQAVIDNSDIIIISVRPEQYSELSSQIKVPNGKIIVSAMAGIGIDLLKSTLNISDNVYRTLPVCCAESRSGLVPVYPSDNKQVNELLSLLGSLCLLNEENEFNGASIASCINGSFYFWYDEMVKWFIKQGYSEDLSRSFVFENIIGTIEYAKLHKDKTLSDIGASIATDGTYTQAGYKELTESGGLTSWSSALDKIKDRFDN